MTTPTLSSLSLYPVKSLGGTAPVEADVEPWGLAGDRRWALATREGARLSQREQPRLALAAAAPLPGGGVRLTAPGRGPLEAAVPEPSGESVELSFPSERVRATPAGPVADAWLSGYLEADVRLMYLDAPERRRPIDPRYARPGETVSLADGFPLLLTSVSSLNALNSLIAQGDHPDEGPLPMDRFRPNVVVSGTPPWAEDDWRRVRIGEVSFRVVKPCGRCVVTTTDQLTAERGKEPLRTLARHRRFGDQLVFGQNLIPEHTGRVRSGDPVEILE